MQYSILGWIIFPYFAKLQFQFNIVARIGKLAKWWSFGLLVKLNGHVKHEIMFKDEKGGWDNSGEGKKWDRTQTGKESAPIHCWATSKSLALSFLPPRLVLFRKTQL